MPRRKKIEPSSRLHLEMLKSTREKLEHLRTVTEAPTLGEVIRRALLVYELLVDHSQKGFVEFTVRGPDSERGFTMLL